MNRLRDRLTALFELPGQNRMLSMEGLRGIAVTLVFFVHFESLFGDWLAPHTASAQAAGFLLEVGHVGVDLFFVLSGYLIYGAVVSKKTFAYGDFMRRRLVRIYPTFAAVFLIYLALSLVLPSESKLPPGRVQAVWYVLENALLLPGMFDIQPLIQVAWSLSYEVFFYAFIPLLVAGLGIRRLSPAARLGVFAAIGVACLIASQLGFGHIQLVMFISGIYVYEAMRAGSAKAQVAPALALGGVVCAAVALPVVAAILSTPHSLGLATHTAYLLRALWLAPVLGMVTLASFQREGPLPRALVATPLRWLGNMSYSYYLIHGLTLKAVSMVAHRLLHGQHPAAHWAVLPVAFAATLCSSAVLYALVEKRYSLVLPARPAGAGASAPALVAAAQLEPGAATVPLVVPAPALEANSANLS